MDLVIDVGASSCKWSHLESGREVRRWVTPGFSALGTHLPDYFSNHYPQPKKGKGPQRVFLYLPGYSGGPQHVGALGPLRDLFGCPEIEMASDLLAAARGMWGEGSGWIGILGTGSNMGYYDGKEVKRFAAPLGYLLGDEGSGVDLGKSFLRDLLRGRVPASLATSFAKEGASTGEAMLEEVYSNPREFLGPISRFIHANLWHDYCRELVSERFDLYLDIFLPENFRQFSEQVRMCGSVAFHFSDMLESAGKKAGVLIGKTAADPLDGLVRHYRAR